MANDQFMTPGSGVADALQEILARKRVEARQQMMDQITAQNSQSEIAARADTAATNKMYRNAESQKLNAQTTALNEQKADEAKRAVYLDTLANDPNTSADVKQWIQLRRGLPKGENVPPPNQFGDQTSPLAVIKPDGTVTYPTSPLTGKPLTGKKGERPITLSNPPAPPNYAPYEGTGPDGKKVLYSFNPRTNQWEIAKTPPGMADPHHLDYKPPTGENTLYDKEAYGKYQTAFTSKGKNSEAGNTARINLINTIKDPHIKADIIAIMNDPKAAALPSQSLIDSGYLYPPDPPAGMPPEQGAAFQKLWLQNAKQILDLVR